MQIVYPPEGHTTFESSSFLVGSVTPGAQLNIGGEDVPVSPSGYFSWPVLLQPGENPITLVEQLPHGVELREVRTLIRSTGLILDKLPDTPEDLFPYVFPASDMTVSPGEMLTLACPAPTGATVSVEIEGLLMRPLGLLPMVSPPDTREGVFAHLHQMQPPAPNLMTAQLLIPENLVTPSVFTVCYTLRQGEQTQVVTAQGRLTIQPAGYRRSAKVLQESTPVRTSPDGGSRLTPLLKGAQLRVSHLRNGHYLTHFGETQQGWVPAEALAWDEAPLAVTTLHTVHCRPEAQAIEVTIPLAANLPHEITAERDRVRIRLYNAVSRCDFIHYHLGVFELGLSEVQWRQTDPATVELEIRLDSPLFGVQHRYDEASKSLVFTAKTQTTVEKTGFTVVIDAGHGGEETGATAPNGTPEKALNLAMARQVAEILKGSPGMNVVLTRENDVTMSLTERTDKARDANGSLLLSLHHNALPDGRDPRKELGVSTFYYHPFALPAARHFQQALVTQTDFEDYGILYDSLHMCRELAMPSLLLELGFFTHPDDAERCLNEAYQNKTAQAIVSAIQNFLKTV